MVHTPPSPRSPKHLQHHQHCCHQPIVSPPPFSGVCGRRCAPPRKQSVERRCIVGPSASRQLTCAHRQRSNTLGSNVAGVMVEAQTGRGRGRGLGERRKSGAQTQARNSVVEDRGYVRYIARRERGLGGVRVRVCACVMEGAQPRCDRHQNERCERRPTRTCAVTRLSSACRIGEANTHHHRGAESKERQVHRPPTPLPPVCAPCHHAPHRFPQTDGTLSPARLCSLCKALLVRRNGGLGNR